LLLLSPSFLVPCLTHNGIKVWDTLAIAEYLNEILPEAGLLPKTRADRAHCRSICGEMHSGFSNMRSALPMNLKARHPGFKVWAGAQADIDRIISIWRECLAAPAMVRPLSRWIASAEVQQPRQCGNRAPSDANCHCGRQKRGGAHDRRRASRLYRLPARRISLHVAACSPLAIGHRGHRHRP
jgi:hypothetical protein